MSAHIRFAFLLALSSLVVFQLASALVDPGDCPDSCRWIVVPGVGPVGPVGPAGRTGERGLQGFPGIDGRNGTQGLKGDTGQRGQQGERGLQGIAGPIGPNGTQGIQGQTGPIGQQGVKGDKGAQGIQGLQGATGPTGPQGPKGDAGSAGLQGVKGDTGPAGPKGDTGTFDSSGTYVGLKLQTPVITSGGLTVKSGNIEAPGVNLTGTAGLTVMNARGSLVGPTTLNWIEFRQHTVKLGRFFKNNHFMTLSFVRIGRQVTMTLPLFFVQIMDNTAGWVADWVDIDDTDQLGAYLIPGQFRPLSPITHAPDPNNPIYFPITCIKGPSLPAAGCLSLKPDGQMTISADSCTSAKPFTAATYSGNGWYATAVTYISAN